MDRADHEADPPSRRPPPRTGVTFVELLVATLLA
jgi:hypothetical protein